MNSIATVSLVLPERISSISTSPKSTSIVASLYAITTTTMTIIEVTTSTIVAAIKTT